MKNFSPKLTIGDTIGIICPSHVPDPARHKRSIAVLKSLGFNVTLGKKFIKIPTVTQQVPRNVPMILMQ